MKNNSLKQTWFGHPRALSTLFSSELWERFSFYTMRNVLTLYMVYHLTYDDNKSTLIYGFYNTLIYVTPLIGGYLADRFLGYRKAIVFGAILMACGQFILSLPINQSLLEKSISLGFFSLPRDYTFYLGMCLLILGNGFFKPNISSIVGSLYSESDLRRDRAYAIFYMGINIGSVFSSLVSGYFETTGQWNFTFLFAGVGMLVGLIIFLSGRKYYVSIGNLNFAPSSNARIKEVGIYASVILLIPIFYLGFSFYDKIGLVLMVTATVFFIYIMYIILKQPKINAQKLIAAVILMLMSIVFWSFFEQAGTSIQLFVKRNVDQNFLGLKIPSSTSNNLFNPLFIILLAVPFSMFWSYLSIKKIEPSSPAKFSLAIVLVGVGFYVFAMGGDFANGGMVPMIFVIGGYLIHTVGELFLSPVGLSTISKLSPVKFLGFMMGAWFLASAYGQYLASVISTFVSFNEPPEGIDPNLSLTIYTDFFHSIGTVAVITGLLFLILSPLIKKLMHNVK